MPAQTLSSPNFWPAAIKDSIGTQTRIGSSSGTIHAETACIMTASQPTRGAHIFSTDPSCPNCMKNMVEAGIRHLYIDHKGFEKYYAKTRMTDFETLTLAICKANGVGVTTIFRKEKRTEEILPETTARHTKDTKHSSQNYASAQTKNGQTLTVYDGPVSGFKTMPAQTSTKYNSAMQPLTRLLMHIARGGITIDPASITSSRVPTSRELTNFIGAGYSALTIIDQTNARDDAAFEALKLLTQHNVLKVN